MRCRTLFATYLYERAKTQSVCRWADVADALLRAACMAMDAAAGRRGDVFTYRIGPGRAGRSHGLKMAALAGLPAPVLARAAELLAGHTAATHPDPAA